MNLAIFDNPLHRDRYTAIFTDMEEGTRGYYMALAMDAAGNGDLVSAQFGPQLGREIRSADLPLPCVLTLATQVVQIRETIREIQRQPHIAVGNRWEVLHA